MRDSAAIRSRRAALLAVSILLFVCCSRSARADVGLVVETPTGVLGFLSDVGHASVWISRACLSASGHVQFCEHSPGVVLTSTSYWPNPGAAAIPADLFFLGETAAVAKPNAAAWSDTLGGIYPSVDPQEGAKYLGRAWKRSIRVLRFETTADQDRTAIAAIDIERQNYRYSYSHRNCAFFAQVLLKHYFGPDFHGNRVLEFGLVTPRSVERAVKHSLRENGTPYETVHFRGRLWHSWREPPRNICESAVLDPKYALPLAFYQPYIYAGFVGCYAVIRILSVTDSNLALTARNHSLPGAPDPERANRADLTRQELTRETFQRLIAEPAIQIEAPTPIQAARQKDPGEEQSSPAADQIYFLPTPGATR